jgi:hypothetical protein
MTTKQDIAEGARNILINCADLDAGDSLVIIHEQPDLGWYDREAPLALAAEAREMGLATTLLEVGEPSNDREPRVVAAMAAHDCTIFFARIGDQDRFAEPPAGKKVVMIYIRDIEMLASPYGRGHHHAFIELKKSVNAVLVGAERIEITCSLGTSLSGGVSGQSDDEGADVGVRRFPLGVPQPVGAADFSGSVALTRFLTPTGSRVYDPPSVAIEKTVFVDVAAGRIDGFRGDPTVVGQIEAHYKRVADLFGIDPNFVHSWHAGIHPGTAYTADAAGDPDRWSNTVFMNPRFLHIHTCGAYAPGEICWMVLDPTVTIDGTPLWADGRLKLQNFAETRQAVKRWPELADLVANPSDQIGVPW